MMNGIFRQIDKMGRTPRSGVTMCHRQCKTAVYLSDDRRFIIEEPPHGGPIKRTPRKPKIPRPVNGRRTPPQPVIVIGADGAGTTTRSLENRQLLPKPFCDADSIAQGPGDPNRERLQAEARAVADRKIHADLRARRSFGFESTCSGKSRPATFVFPMRISMSPWRSREAAIVISGVQHERS